MRFVLVSSGITPKMERGLRLQGFEPILLPPLPSLPRAIASHPDTLIFKLSETVVTSADYCERAGYIFSDIREYSKDIVIKVTSDEPGDVFPRDCTFNALRCKDYLFCREVSISETVKSVAKENGLTVVGVKQGYPACSAISAKGAIITADEGLLRAASGVGLSTYRIEAGHISLPPYEYGFIGGASGVIDSEIYFFGDYRLHPSAKEIERAAEELGLKLISLSDEPLTDFGGMIFL